MTDLAKEPASATPPIDPADSVDHTTRWVFTGRNPYTREEVRQLRHDDIRRTWEPLGNSLGDRLKRMRRELYLWWN